MNIAPRTVGFILVMVVCVLLSGCSHESTPANVNSGAGSTPTPINQTMKLTSTVFTEGGPIPSKYTCDGENISPPLTWSGIPPSTKSLALIVDDPDAPGKTWVHWIVYNLSPASNSLNENMPATNQINSQAFQGTNDFKKIGYGGPCPPSGTHRYFFKLYALDSTVTITSERATKDELLRNMQGHIIAQAELIGLYKR